MLVFSVVALSFVLLGGGGWGGWLEGTVVIFG